MRRSQLLQRPLVVLVLVLALAVLGLSGLTVAAYVKLGHQTHQIRMQARELQASRVQSAITTCRKIRTVLELSYAHQPHRQTFPARFRGRRGKLVVIVPRPRGDQVRKALVRDGVANCTSAARQQTQLGR